MKLKKKLQLHELFVLLTRLLKLYVILYSHPLSLSLPLFIIINRLKNADHVYNSRIIITFIFAKVHVILINRVYSA